MRGWFVVLALALAALAALTDGESASVRVAKRTAFLEWVSSDSAMAGFLEHVDVVWDDGRNQWTMVMKHGVSVEKEEEVTLLRVPVGRLMSWKSAQESELRDAFEEHAKLLNSHIALVLHLMYESGQEDSPWKPYLDMLPTSYETPLFWSKAELSELEGSEIVGHTKEDFGMLRSQYERVITPMMQTHPDIFTRKVFSRKRFAWAWATVWAYKVNVMVEPKKPGIALIPFFDMLVLNRTSSLHAVFNRHERVFKISIMGTGEDANGAALEQGQPLVRSVYPKSNTQILYSLGRSMGDAYADKTYAFPLKLSSKNLLYDERLKILEAHHFSANDRSQLYVGESINPDVLAFLRITRMSVTEMDAADDSTDYYKPMSTATELKIHTLLAKRLRKKLAKYPTSIQEDNATIAEIDAMTHPTTTHRRLRLAAIVRRDEKTALAHNLALAEAAIHSFPDTTTQHSEL